MWYWYLIMFFFGAAVGGLATLIGIMLINNDEE